MVDFLRPPTPPEPPKIVCESCGQEVSEAEAIGFVVTFFRPGKTAAVLPMTEGLPMGSFGCYAGGHLACSVEHARQVAIRCIDEHLIPGRERKEANTISGVS